MSDRDNIVAEYSEKFVAFIDILGFSEIVKRSETDPKWMQTLADALNQTGSLEASFMAVQKGTRAEDGELHFTDDTSVWRTSISDSLVFSTHDASNNYLYMMLMWIEEVVLRLLEIGVLCRGGIAKGKFFHSRATVFGPAMVTAYKLETTVARNPRIILDTSVLSAAERMSKLQRVPLICKDTDASYFNFLAFSIRKPDGHERLARAKEMLARRFSEAQEIRRLEKITWIPNYFNSSLEQKWPELVIQDCNNSHLSLNYRFTRSSLKQGV